MTGTGATYLAALFCLYALFEFLLKRLFWNRVSGRARVGRTTLAQAAVLFATLLVGSAGFVSPALVVGYTVIAAVYALHGFISRAGGRDAAARSSLERFLLRQVLMGTLLFLVWRLAMPGEVHNWFAMGQRMVNDSIGEVSVDLRVKPTLVLAIITAYVFVIDGGTGIVKGILGKFPALQKRAIHTLSNGASDVRREENVGEWIGILERIIALTFVLSGHFTAIALVLTAKSIARFKELENKDFAEYYLLGTSSSLIAALGPASL